MAFRKRTLRTMSPTARKVARLAGEIESAATRLKNMIPELQTLDLESQALTRIGNQNQSYSLQDTDLWGLENALQHGLQDGYLKDNEEWAKSMLERISKLREKPEEIF